MGLPISQIGPAGFVFTSERPHYSLTFFFFKLFPIRFPIIEAVNGGTSSLQRFPEKKKLLVQRNRKASKKRNDVFTLPWKLRCQYNIAHIKQLW